ncbi:helix-turn-helix domain-containing protein [Niveispirillum sp. KHB5.9]|uniref:helix-turn-helix domain-containing protein n=1 Tax=Niveispirillum sp. KHB5.9 TaxID=3400269 RepID=UPI003A86C945
MNALSLRPIHEDQESVTLRRADFEALLEMLEDAQDMAEIQAAMRRLERGEEEAVPFELAEQIMDGMHPVRVYRQYRELTQQALAEQASVSPSYLSEIESGRKPGSLEAMTRLSGVLRIPVECLLPPKRAD